jgi:dihydrofolate reductase
MKMNRKVILYIAASLDGYIAKPEDNLSFLSTVEKENEDYGYMTFMSTVDTVILGRKTYDWILDNADFPFSDKETYVITRFPGPGTGKIIFYTGNIKDLMLKLKSEEGKNIYCGGGAEIVNEFLNDDLIDEFVISIIPILIGRGIQLFQDGRPEQKLVLVSAKWFETGLVQIHYRRDHN